MLRLGAVLLGLIAVRGCVAYEYEHEFWLRTDGSGSVNITGRPGLWTAFKALGRAEDPEATANRETVRALFESSGLRVKRVTLTRREGRPYLFISAEFDDIASLSGTAAFPDLRIGLHPEGERLRLEGTWSRPSDAPDIGTRDQQGLMAVRFHLPSKIYGHHNAFGGVERGNIVGWRQDVQQGLAGQSLDFGAVMDSRSILGSTVRLFATAIAVALSILAGGLYLALRRGRRRRAEEAASSS